MDKNICIKFGKHIRNLRMKHRLTQDQLAERSGISTKYLQNLESPNPKKASIVTLEKLAKGFDIPLPKILAFIK